MKLLNEVIIKNKFIAKLRVLFKLMKSGNYIVILIDRNPKKTNESVTFQFNVSDGELEFYAKNLIEFRKRSMSLLDKANNIIKN